MLQKNPRGAEAGLASSKIEAVASPSAMENPLSVKAVVTVKPSTSGLLSKMGISGGLDKITDLVGKTLLLELVSTELDPKTGREKGTIKGYAYKKGHNKDEVTYECEFEVGEEFGEVGAIFVENEHHKEMYLKDIVLNGFVGGPLNITCISWVHSKYDNPQKRVFFTNKCYLPTETPSGLRRPREEELAILRGNGQGERKSYERIYDYDVYNDLGNPDSDAEKKRPVLGGKELPYPRRCRTGRPQCETDPQSELRSGSIYVPRDEQFSTIKQMTFSAKTVYSVVHALVPSLETAMVDADLGFPYFSAIDKLFNEGVNLPPLQKQGFLKDLFPRLVKTVTDAYQAVLRFETPETMNRNRFFWFTDEEFSRQTLAGINPIGIKMCTQEWPLRSDLDPKIYGSLESAITTDIIEREIKGFMTVDEAIKQRKLFMLDYHDLFLPYVNKVRQLKGTTLYGSRTLFFLTPDETLKLLAIELTRPPTDDGKPQWKQVFTPSCHSTGMWLWRLAKAHVLAHDSGYHQLVSHWLRTHCVTEPYIIAANRQLSAMHPIYKLLHPHFRYTMEINALAREYLVNGDGIIESSFSPGKYSMELCAVAYDKLWQFDSQGLPNDLISRGLAVEDPTAPHGLKLAIEDYPFANDGLLLWDAIKEWVTDYVNHYYPDPSHIASDKELQSWWTEIRTVGHGDKKDSPGWPDLKTPSDLIHIITTIVWVASGHHAAVNFGQYTYGGYFPNRPTIARTKMPVADPTEEELKIFWNKPEVTLLTCFPSPIQATKVMAILDVLSNHSPDEEYLGQDPEPAWKEEPAINAAFKRFHGRLKELDGVIDARNNDQRFKNRNGAGIVPYELLKPFSEPGVTGKGVPYSISI
ncbi:linoleate 13S-lipoxygenase 2-1, chloroplastic [Eucalyptus grandis]|uniref:linoleate 13S-lipoxygenase 2-1, chloroplastic n=1 Tax=Eucalyptus grandis TaxID=71139 RepID=UPI00192EB010|nr:linoleate 13S-lipoxygenase 2-1, chloroplastic [Eucalyptus grandis]